MADAAVVVYALGFDIAVIARACGNWRVRVRFLSGLALNVGHAVVLVNRTRCRRRGRRGRRGRSDGERPSPRATLDPSTSTAIQASFSTQF
jgi:hypothetical protein